MLINLKKILPVIVTHTCDLNTREAEAQGFNCGLQQKTEGTSDQSIKKNQTRGRNIPQAEEARDPVSTTVCG